MQKKFIENIETILMDNGFSEDIEIKANIKNGGQSITFIISVNNEKKYIAKFFDHLKNIPDDVIDLNNGSLDNIEKFKEYISEQNIPYDVDAVLEQIYYSRRAFDRYVFISGSTNGIFPKLYCYKSDILIDKKIYGIIIEEFIPGVLLLDYLSEIDRDNIDILNETIKFLQDISLTIKEYENHAIVHRDISPDNIILTSSGLMVIDPGVIKLINRNSTNVHCIIGKMMYCSPEQYLGNSKNTDFTSDLYSIGIILYEFVTGVNLIGKYRNLHEAIPHEYINRKLDNEIEDIFMSSVNEDDYRSTILYGIIKKLLQYNKVFRFESVDSFMDIISLLVEVKND